MPTSEWLQKRIEEMRAQLGGHQLPFWLPESTPGYDGFKNDYLDFIRRQGQGFGGMEIVTSDNMVTSVTRSVPRTWRERLFSWPWRPWKRKRVEVVNVPLEYAIVKGNQIVMHPAMYDALRKHLNTVPVVDDALARLRNLPPLNNPSDWT